MAWSVLNSHKLDKQGGGLEPGSKKPPGAAKRKFGQFPTGPLHLEDDDFPVENIRLPEKTCEGIVQDIDGLQIHVG
jgi:hypothetical protein